MDLEKRTRVGGSVKSLFIRLDKSNHDEQLFVNGVTSTRASVAGASSRSFFFRFLIFLSIFLGICRISERWI